MNEKEMIEEMAKVIDDRLIEANNYLGSMNKGNGYWIAQKLVEHYQPKIPKGFVILSNEEWARLRNLEINYDDAYEDYLKYEIENQQLKKKVKELEEQRDRQAYIAEELIQEKHRWTEQARKETAKEVITEMFKQIEGYENIDVILNRIAKKYGVEVEE